MKLWECRYTLDCPLWTDEYVDYWYSVNGPTIMTVRHHWDKISPEIYTVSDFHVTEVKSERGPMVTLQSVPYSRVINRQYKP